MLGLKWMCLTNVLKAVEELVAVARGVVSPRALAHYGVIVVPRL
jgi:hypothetical protein